MLLLAGGVKSAGENVAESRGGGAPILVLMGEYKLDWRGGKIGLGRMVDARLRGWIKGDEEGVDPDPGPGERDGAEDGCRGLISRE
jgi:hypothetical protein